MDNYIEDNRKIKNHAVTSKKIGVSNSLNKEEKYRFMQEFMSQVFRKLENNKLNEETLVIDRFEEDIAVCENRETQQMINIERNKLPRDSQEGDVIKFVNNTYVLDENEKKEIEERIQNKIANLFED